MPKAHLKIIGTCLLILTISEASKDQPPDLALAKRSLLEREREFFKSQPMSADLRSFIERYKRRNQREDRREKRSQNIDESLLYVIQDGQLVPVRSMKGFKRSDEEQKKATNAKHDANAFTVVPLVIPINIKAPESKLIRARTLDDELQNPGQNVAPASPVSVGTSTAVGGGGEKGTTEQSVNEENPEDVSDDGNSTKEETQVLHKILEDVEGLMQWKHEGNKKEGVLCNINGSWISDAAGMRFDVCYRNSTRKKFRIHVADRIPPNEDGFLCDGNWTVFGELPFLHSGMVIALAVHEKDKHIATFIGECRICEGSETVTGTWLIGRSSRDCKDQKASHKILSDVWRREQGHTLRKKHLQQIGLNVNDDED